MTEMIPGFRPVRQFSHMLRQWQTVSWVSCLPRQYTWFPLYYTKGRPVDILTGRYHWTSPTSHTTIELVNHLDKQAVTNCPRSCATDHRQKEAKSTHQKPPIETSWTGHPSGRIKDNPAGISLPPQSLFRKSHSTPTTRLPMESCHWIKARCTSLHQRKNIPSHPIRKRSSKEARWWTVGQRVHMPLKESIWSALLLHQKEEWRTQTNLWLLRTQQVDRQESLPPTTHIRAHLPTLRLWPLY